MPPLYFGKNQQPGDQELVGDGSELGSQTINGTLHVVGTSRFDDDVKFNGNVTLSSTTRVDILSTSIYDFEDPVIELNTSFSAAYIPEAGLSIFRGIGEDYANLFFTEADASRTVKSWKIGIGVDMLRVARIADTLTDQHAMLWSNSTFSITSHPDIDFEPTYALFSIPVIQELEAADSSPYILFNDAPGKNFTIENDHAMALMEKCVFQFMDYAYGGLSMSEGVDFSATSAMRFRVIGPDANRVQYIFDSVANFGVDVDGSALLRTDATDMRIEGASTVSLRAGPVGTSQLVATTIDVDANVDLDMNNHDIVAAASIETGELTYELLNVTPYLQPIPIVPLWDGSITYDSITYVETTSNVQDQTVYEVKITFTNVSDGPNRTIVAPINIGGDLSLVRSVTGVVQKLSAPLGPVVQVTGIPTGDIWIQPPFELDPTYLTYPGNLDSFHLLSINIVQRTGTFVIVATVSTKVI